MAAGEGLPLPSARFASLLAMSLILEDAARLYDTLRHFLEAAIHLLLFHRGLYPARAFAAAAAFDVPVQQCRHPAVGAWVRDAVGAAMEALTADGTVDNAPDDGDGLAGRRRRRVDTIALVVHAPLEKTAETRAQSHLPPGAVLERWVFDVRHLPRGVPGGSGALRQATRAARTADTKGKKPQQRSLPKRRDGGDSEELLEDGSRYDYYDEQDELAQAESEAELDDLPEELDAGDGDVDGGGDRNGQTSAGPTMNWADLQQQLRGVLLRLGQAAAGRGRLPDKSSFTLAMQLGDDPDAAGTARTGQRTDTGGLGPGQPAAWIPHAYPGSPGSSGTSLTTTTTIRTVDAPPLFFECWMEENLAARRERPQGDDVRKNATGASRPGRGGKTVSFG